MADKGKVPRPVHEEGKPLESKALVITAGILQRKWLVIGVPVAAVVVAIILISINASRAVGRRRAAAAYESAEGIDELLEVHNKYSNTPYGARALAAAAKKALDDTDYGRARELSEEYLRKYPENRYSVFVKRYVAMSFEAEGKYEEAIGKYKDILEKDPRMEVMADSLIYQIGMCYEQMGEYETARSWYVRLSAGTDPGSQYSQADLGVWGVEANRRIAKIEKRTKAEKSEHEEAVETVE